MDAGDTMERGVRAVLRPKLLALPSGLTRSISMGTPRLPTPCTPRSPFLITPHRLASFTPDRQRSIGARSHGDMEKTQGPETQDGDLQVPLLDDKNCAGSKAPLVVLGFECLESTAFNGISTNLVMYLETVLHGSNVASASNVTLWFGTSYLTPVFGAIIADAFWGNYNTILVSLAIYLLGMILVTLSAFLPTDTVLGGSSVFGAHTVAFVGLYLVAIGSGGVRSSLLTFGAEQFDDDNAADRENKLSFFSWFYLCVDFGPIVSGLFIVWIQENISWGLGFGISTACIALALGAFVLATPMYKRSTPTAGKASVISDSETGLEAISEEAGSSQKLRAATKAEEFKTLLGLLPIWATSIIVSSAYTQMNTTFIQQGSAMNVSVLSVQVPPASMGSFEVVCVLIWVLLYGHVIVPALRGCGFSFGGDGEPSQLQRMGAGRLLMALAMAVAALVEMKRLGSAARGEEITIAWQIPQYFFLAGAEVLCYIAQLEFFYEEAPETMKSTCTSLALLTIALGSYLSSFIYAIVAAFTATADSPGWISDNLNQGHLDYFFWTMAAISALNFVVYSVFARNYKPKSQDYALMT
ncbi:protein NRT1/ PTR FAMILY 8.3 [Zea mays]|uniref:Protein NRT1/ PTR FAMILY 8.3 n=2 Tax=Zea mays TaxID=4577 RepID=A0A1D6HGS5_MAIZE|nr:protein NRT1/ PTR FAMILY 8.3 [Zea mays]AQK73799.1 Protein NRT1/ PTR FAMILY 8.3 [Zea mays]|eukprot:XP_008646114.1 protein NRT1/ PTR FAMILY 8.3 [Zea mays]